MRTSDLGVAIPQTSQRLWTEPRVTMTLDHLERFAADIAPRL